MKNILILGLLCTIALQQTILLSSSATNTIVTDPPGYKVAVEDFHSIRNPSYINFYAQWIYKNGSDQWPAGDNATFFTEFYADCLKNATLIVAVDGSFVATLNSKNVFSGNVSIHAYKFNIDNLKCGVNTLSFFVSTRFDQAPTAIVFTVVQDQTACYNCATPLSFYSREACKCQCVDKSSCPAGHPLYKWNDYPICGCKCDKNLSCKENQYFNANKCSCLCIPKACLPGFVQSSSSCNCVCAPQDCPKDKVWNASSCSCSQRMLVETENIRRTP